LLVIRPVILIDLLLIARLAGALGHTPTITGRSDRNKAVLR